MGLPLPRRYGTYPASAVHYTFPSGLAPGMATQLQTPSFTAGSFSEHDFQPASTDEMAGREYGNL